MEDLNLDYRVKEKLAGSEEELSQKKEISDRWNWEKDGKSYRTDLSKKEKSK